MSANASTRPARPSAKRLGCYLYAVVDAAEDQEFGPFGIDGGMVHAIGDGRVAAVVSDLADEKIRPERRKLAAHHEVLKRLMPAHTVLPMSFGLVAASPDAVRRILAQNKAALTEQLRRVAGKVEMGLRVLWDVPNFLEYFVQGHAELAEMRDQLFRGGRDPAPESKIELGRLFDRLLTEERAALTQQVVDVLQRSCAEIKENKVRSEREVMNLACLIARDAQKEFEQGVFEAAKFFDNHYAFDFNGPWPPHNFVELALDV